MSKTFADRQAEHYDRNLTKVARELRALADEVELRGKMTENAVDAPAYGWAAHGVIHAISWGIANLHLDSLVLAAAEADRADREKENE